MATRSGKRLFDARLELIAALDSRSEGARRKVKEATVEATTGSEDATRTCGSAVRSAAAGSGGDEPGQLRRSGRTAVWWRSMRKPDAWVALAADAFAELSHEVAGLPSELDPENEEAKRFDLLAEPPDCRAYAPSPGLSGYATGSRRSRDSWRRRTRSRWCGSRWRSSRTCRPTNGGRMSRCRCSKWLGGGSGI